MIDKCWCTDINYECRDCEKKEMWLKLSEIDKLDLLVYEKQLKLNRPDQRLAMRILNRDLCVSMIPERKTL